MMERFQLEDKSIFLARIFLGLLSFFYFCGLWTEVDIFFSNNAIVPYDAILNLSRENSVLPLLKHFQSSSSVHLLVVIGMISSLLFAIGYWSRLFIVLTWLIVMAFSNRFPDLSFAADNTLKLSLFWFFFLSQKYENKFLRSSLHLMWMIQIFLMYEFSLYQKLLNPHWFGDFDALFYVFNSTHLLKPAGHLLSSFPLWLFKGMTLGTLIFEFVAPFCLFIILPKIRWIIVSLFILFHVGIWLTLDVGLFSLFCIVWWLTLLPSIPQLKFELKSFQKFQKIEWSFISIIFILIFIQSVNDISNERLYDRKSWPTRILHKLQAKPNWNMFTENPPVGYDGWFIADANGTDLFTNEKVTFTPPQSHHAFYPSIHWRLFLRKFRLKHPGPFKQFYGSYLCKQTDSPSVKLIFMKKEVSPATSDKIEEQTVFLKDCLEGR